MKKSILLFFIFSLIMKEGFCQHETDNWYYRFNHIKFENGIIVWDSLTQMQNEADEGSACISNKNTGESILYTGGLNIWNNQNAIMQNGADLCLESSTTTMSSLVVPFPNDTNKFYVFLQGAEVGYFSQTCNGLKYAVVDISANSGSGSVLSVSDLIDSTEEKVAGVFHANNHDVWVVVHKWNTKNFYAYLITDNGISAPVISSAGTIHYDVNSYSTIGYMNFSPDGNYLALVCSYVLPRLEIFKFNHATGVVSNPLFEHYTVSDDPYGLCFSPDNSKLYVTTNHSNLNFKLFQYDLNNPYDSSILLSKTLIDTTLYRAMYAMQNGPDHKIYVSGGNLHRINKPNLPGLQCDFQKDAYVHTSGGSSDYGLPNFIASYFDTSFVINNIPSLESIESINIFPNPTDGNFTITTSTTIQQIEVINLLGEKVYSLRCNTPTPTLHLTTLSKGVYFIRIKTADGLVMKKVVVE